MKKLITLLLVLSSFASYSQSWQAIGTPGMQRLITTGPADTLYRFSNGIYGFTYFKSFAGMKAAFSATPPIFYNSATGVISSQAASSSLAGYVTTGAQSFAGIKTFNSVVTGGAGGIFRGVVGGSSVFRNDPQIVASNEGAAPGVHGLILIENHDPTDEAALTMYGKLSNGNGQQHIGAYSRFVNGVNTFNNFDSTFGMHLPGYGEDNTIFEGYSNNSLWLNCGAVTDQQWNILPPDNHLIVGGLGVFLGNGFATGAVTRTSGFGLESRNGNARFADLTTNKGIEIGYSTGISSAFLQGYDRDLSAFIPLSISGSLTTFTGLTEFSNVVNITRVGGTSSIRGTTDISIDATGSNTIFIGAYSSGPTNIGTGGGMLNLATTPTTSAGSYDILTRNSSTGVVEKVSGTTGFILNNATTTPQSASIGLTGDIYSRASLGSYPFSAINNGDLTAKVSATTFGTLQGDQIQFGYGGFTQRIKPFATLTVDRIVTFPDMDGVVLTNISGSFSDTGAATTTFTVTIGQTMANTSYKTNITPTSVLALGGYVTNKTTTTFDYVLPSTTGAVTLDFSIFP